MSFSMPFCECCTYLFDNKGFIHSCIMGVWALKLAPGAWYCAVMCYSRRCSCGQTSAVMGLNLGAILHARGKMVRRNLRLGGKAGIPSQICASG